MSAVGETPKLINDVFLTKTKNSAGIHAFSIYIRGKPWHIVTDDKLLFYTPKANYVQKLAFAQPSTDGAMWAPMIEKAYAKLKGSYTGAESGLLSNSIRMLTGVPSFGLKTSDWTDDAKRDAGYNQMKEADKAGYIVSGGTKSSSDGSD